MTLDQTEYPGRDSRPSISACQWIQYQLDNCSTIQDVINTDKGIRIVDRTSKFHFLICDSSGKGAVIEFINGKMIAWTNGTLPVAALANSPYGISLSAYQTKMDPAFNRSLYNFCAAARMIDIDSINNVPWYLADHGIFINWIDSNHYAYYVYYFSGNSKELRIGKIVGNTILTYIPPEAFLLLKPKH